VADNRRALVYGLHAVAAVLQRKPEQVLELWVAAPRDDARARSLREQASIAGAHIHSVSNEALVKMVGQVTHQGVVASMRPLPPWNDQDLLACAKEGRPNTLFLVLDGVTDPHNLGACLRSADAAGAKAVVIPKDRSAEVDGTVRKVAAGAAEFIPVASVTNLARTLSHLKQAGIWVVGAAEDADKTLYEADLNRPLALVLGAEGAGLRRLTKETCDFLVRIPMAGQVESLNVSVAAGVSLYEARRQQGFKR
jgi:23S rRNA (guanosine2251-2'-O)-methyltransferase